MLPSQTNTIVLYCMSREVKVTFARSELRVELKVDPFSFPRCPENVSTKSSTAIQFTENDSTRSEQASHYRKVYVSSVYFHQKKAKMCLSEFFFSFFMCVVHKLDIL